MNYMQERTLLELIKDKYSQIIPEQKIGVVLFKMYDLEKQKVEKTFSEKEIFDIIDSFSTTDSERDYFIYKNQIVQDLSKFFIEKDKRRNYRLTDFAKEFCRLIEKELNLKLNPSDIEKTIQDLIELLRNRIASVEDFNHWYEHSFESDKINVSNQIRALEMQVKLTIESMNELIFSHKDDFTTMLDICKEKLNNVKAQADKLSNALDLKEEIREILSAANLEDRNFRDKKKLINDFLHEIDTKLISISHQIDSIKPKLNRLFNDINKREYDRKLENFLSYLFQNSSSEKLKNKKLKKEGEERREYEINIHFPQNVPEKFIIDLNIKFEAIFYANFLNQTSISAKENADNEAEVHRQLVEKERKTLQQLKAIRWFEKLKNQIDVEGNISYSHFFYQIMQEENDIEIAIKTTDEVLKSFTNERYEESQRYSLNIEKEFAEEVSQTNTILWKMKIQKRVF